MKKKFMEKNLKLLFLFFLFSTAMMYSQDNIIKGNITSSDNIPIPGVSIVQKGTNNGTTTDFNGNYTLKLTDGVKVLKFSYLGYKTVAKVVTGGSTVNIKLQEDTNELDEVVVVGYGTQRKSDISGAISSIQAKDLEDTVLTSVGQVLQGRASGVYVTEASGEPGGGLDINIRGLNSVSGNGQPLYILDGIPLSLDNQAQGDSGFTETNPLAGLNPNDIENIEVLKDASSTAIYGSRASNGVILITTKSAKAGKAKIKGSIRSSIVSAGQAYKLMNAPQYNQVRNDWVLLDNPTQTFDQLVAAGTINYPDININGSGTDFLGSVLQTATMKDYSLSVSGGSKDFSQLLSLSLSDQEGVVVASGFTRGNLRYNSKMDLSKNWSITSNMQLNYTKNRRVVNTARTGLTGVLFNAFRIDPNKNLFDDEGELLDSEDDGTFVANPLSNALYDQTFQTNRDAILSLSNTINLTKGLIWTTRVGLTNRLSHGTSFADSRTARGRQDSGRLQISNATTTNLSVESFFNYDKKIGNHSITGLLGTGYEDQTNERDRQSYTNFTFEDYGPDAIELAQIVTGYGSNKTNITLQSGFFRLGYTYNDKYILTVNGRADGTSKFINGKPWGFFPSGALAWNVKKESFLRNFRPISDFKLRASYGITGSQSGVNALASQSIYDIDRITLPGDVIYNGAFPANIANRALTWESNKALNYGLDFGLFKNKIKGSVEYYERVTDNLLNNIPVAAQTGFNNVALNRGSLKNTGIEVSLDFNIIRTKNFKWNSKINWTTNKTILQSYGSQDFINGPNIAANFFAQPVSRTYIGDQIGKFYGYNIIGLIQPDQLVDYANGNFNVKNGPDGQPLFVSAQASNRPGTWIFEDINKDGQITIEDSKELGNPNPDFFFGWNNSFNIGAFNISAFFQGSVGNDVLNINKAFTGIGWAGGNGSEEFFNKRWTLANQHNDVNFPSGQNVNPVNAPNSVLVEDGSFVRLKNLSVRYAIPTPGSTKINLTLIGTNLFTWTKYSGPDPEVNTNRGNAFSRGVDYEAYPRAKVYSLSLDFNF